MAKRYYDNMIKEDRSAMANLPQQVMIKKYPPYDSYLGENLNDGIGGIDYQMSKDASKEKRGKQPEKY